ncbi:Methyltransferase-like protein 22 [Dissophora globulifera]|uniref:Methyltransferase-like protein 22 n=1 Tax=Dissophora globulifera TaxID=979702 RepID=A0A9P6UU73_9FUNG|nr:Methyltransferase-like protein 22 [Dissophora globulifera]
MNETSPLTTKRAIALGSGNNSDSSQGDADVEQHHLSKRPRLDESFEPSENMPGSEDHQVNDNDEDADIEDEDMVLSEVHINPKNGRADGRFITSIFHLGRSVQRTIPDSISENPVSREDVTWDYAVEIEHAMGTPLMGVGSQVWMGGFLLMDWMVNIKDQLLGSVVMELGAGTGLASIALCIATDIERVFCTDYSTEILSNCERNITRNSQHEWSDSQPSSQLDNRVLVRRYNWLMPDPLDTVDDPLDWYNWTPQDREEWRSKGAFIVAADVIYDDSLTDALITSLETLLAEPLPESHPRYSIGRVAYLSMEKRYNFSVEQLDVVAQAHDYFVQQIANSKVIEARRVDCSEIDQYCDYVRSKDLELYRVTILSSGHPSGPPP